MKVRHVYANPGARIIGVGVSDPPVTGGVVFDSFEHGGADHKEHLRIAEERNGPLRLERFEQGAWQPYPERFAATSAGYDEAIVLLRQMLSIGLEARLRIVTRSGAVIGGIVESIGARSQPETSDGSGPSQPNDLSAQTPGPDGDGPAIVVSVGGFSISESPTFASVVGIAAVGGISLPFPLLGPEDSPGPPRPPGRHEDDGSVPPSLPPSGPTGPTGPVSVTVNAHGAIASAVPEAGPSPRRSTSSGHRPTRRPPVGGGNQSASAAYRLLSSWVPSLVPEQAREHPWRPLNSRLLRRSTRA